jgi:DHA2 family multidrug resistance protein
MIVTPIVGRIYNRVSPRLVIAVGVLFIAWGAYDMSHFTLESGQGDVIWAIVTQGVGFSCLFVPLSTVALASIPRHKMADATGLNSLFRQVGGSIGLAVGATLLTRYGAQARAAMLAHVTPSSAETMARVQQMTAGYVRRGFDPIAAREMALRALDGVVGRQATLLAFDRVFIIAGVAFLAVLPLLFFLKTPNAPLPTSPRMAGGDH